MNLYFLMFKCIVFYLINGLHFVDSFYPKIAQFCKGYVLCSECGICKKDLVGGVEAVTKEICDKSFFLGNKNFDIFTEDCKARNMCSQETCLNSRNCKPLFGSLDCDCNPGYYGQDCANQIVPLPSETEYASGISIMYSPFGESLAVSFMLVAVQTPGKNLEVEFDNGMGLKIIQTIQAAKFGNATRICLKCGVAPFRLCHLLTKDFENDAFVFIFLTVYPITRRFYEPDDGIFIQNFTNDRFKEGRKYELGVKVRNKLNLENWKPEQFAKKYQKIVWNANNKSHVCAPIFYDFRGCSRDGKLINTYYRTSEFSLRVEYKIPDFCKEKDIIKWSFWKKIPNFEETLDVPKYQKPYKESSRSMIGHKYSVDEGEYIAKATVQYPLDDYKSATNFMYCYFNLKLEKIQIIIAGGHERTSNFKKDIILDVSKSINPNERENKSSLTFSWSCVPKINDPVCNGTPSSATKFIIHGPFEIGKNYSFTVTANSKDKPSDDIKLSTTQIVQMVETDINSLLIRCWKNCGDRFNSTTHEIVYLEAYFQEGFSVSPGVKLTWKYTVDGSEEKDITPLRQPDTPDYILIVDEEKMNLSLNYVFSVHGKGEEMAQYKLLTSANPIPGKCSIDPKEGVMGVTKFTIICTKFYSVLTENSLTYEFYDNKPGQPGLGVYIGSAGSAGILTEVMLVGGVITVHVMDTICMFVRDSLTATITNNTFEQHEISLMIQTARTTDKTKMKDVMRLVAVLAETAQYTKNKEEEMLNTLDIISQLQGDVDVNTLKLFASGLSNYLKLMSANEENGLRSSSTQVAGYIMEYIGEVFVSFYTDVLREEREIESRSIRQIAMYITECAEVLFKTKNKTILSYSVMTNEQENVMNQYKEGFVSTIRSLEMTAQSGGFNLLPYQRMFSTSSSAVFIWARLSVETEEMAEFIAERPYLDLHLSKEFCEEVDAKPGSLIVEVVTMKKNPFWWYRGCYNVVESTVASVKLRKKHIDSKKTITKLIHPIVIYLNLSTIERKPVTGTTYRLNREDDFDTKNAAVSIHRIETPVGAKLFLEFLNVSESLKVVVLKNMIPDYDYMENLGINITKDKPLYDVQDVLTNTESFFYVGVLPGNDLNGTEKNISFSFEVTAANCMTWDTTILGRRCDVLLDSTQERLHCSCGHLSVITGSKISAPNVINRDSDLKFSMNLEANIVLFIYLPILFLLYFIILLWALFKDRKDKDKALIIVLDDNYPGDDFGYLVAVYTGSRILAGTNANVGIRLFGNVYKSRAHILRSSKRKTMQRCDEDSFLLFTPEHLGEIHHIHVWRDNEGMFTDWFCDKIVVYDLEAGVEYIFPIDQWLTPKVEQYLEVYVAPTQKKDLETQSNLTLENIVLGLRETHIWASVVIRHPRTAMTRTDRVAVCMCFVMLSLLTTVVYYYVFEDPEDDPYFMVTLRELLIVIVSAIIICPIIYLILLLFRDSSVKQMDKTDEQKDVEPEEKNIQLEENTIPTGKNHGLVSERKHVYETANKIKTKMLKPKLLRPVWLAPMDDNKEEIYTKTSRHLIPCIICQTVIVVSAIFIIILGMKLGKFKTEKWLVTAGFVVFQDICLYLPLKILILASILGYYNRKMFYVDTYHFDYEEAKRENMIGNNDYLFELEKLRSKPMYHPLTRAQVTAIRAKRQRIYFWGLFLDFLIVLLFFILLCLYINDMYSARFYHTNNQIQKALIHRTVEGTLNLEEVDSSKRFIDYVALTIFPNIYKGLNINNVLKSDFDTTKFGHAGWFADDVHRLVGIPRLRQLRVRKGQCEVPAVLRKSDTVLECLPSFNDYTEETLNYKFSWNKYSWKERDYDKEPYPSPWVYVTPENSKSTYFYGFSGTKYNTGGYIVNLGRSMRETNYTLAETLYSKWFDQHTKVIIVELQLYAVNSNTFSIVSILLEFVPGGMPLHRTKVQTLDDKREWLNWTITFLFFTAYFAWLNIYNLNEHGVFNCLTRFWDYVEIIMLLLCVLNVGLLIYHILYTANITQACQMAGKDVFFSYGLLLAEFRTMLLFSFILFACLTMRLLRSFKFGRRLKVLLYTLRFTARSIFCLTITYIIFLLIISMIISFIFDSPFVHTWLLFFMYRTGYNNLVRNSVFPQKRLILVIYCFSAALFSSVFIILYSYFFTIAKCHKLLKPERLNYFTFLAKELGLAGNKDADILKRLRGGTDAHTLKLSKPYEMLMSFNIRQYIKCRLSQSENTGSDNLQAIQTCKEIPLEYFFGSEKLINQYLECEKNRNQRIKFIKSNLNYKLALVVSKIDILLDEND